MFGTNSIIPFISRPAVDYKGCRESKGVIAKRILAITAAALAAIAAASFFVNPFLLVPIALCPLLVAGVEWFRARHYTDAFTVKQYNKNYCVNSSVLARIGTTERTAKKVMKGGSFNPYKTDRQGRTALYWCANPSVAKMLLEKHMNPMKLRDNGWSAMHEHLAILQCQDHEQSSGQQLTSHKRIVSSYVPPLEISKRPEVILQLIETMEKINKPFEEGTGDIPQGELPLILALKIGYQGHWKQIIHAMIAKMYKTNEALNQENAAGEQPITVIQKKVDEGKKEYLPLLAKFEQDIPNAAGCK